MKPTRKILEEFWLTSSKRSTIKVIIGFSDNLYEANCFNQYFSTVGSELAYKIPYVDRVFESSPLPPTVFELCEIMWKN